MDVTRTTRVCFLDGGAVEAKAGEERRIGELLSHSSSCNGRAPPIWLVDGFLSAVRTPAPSLTRATPVQAECWAWLLASEPPDLVAISPTGSGKTLAFLVPAFCSLLAHNPSLPPAAEGEPTFRQGSPRAAAPHVLVLAPTRELCQQTATVAERIVAAVSVDPRAAPWAPATLLATACVYGGVDYRAQRTELLAPVEGRSPRLLIATPGRLLSLCGEVPESTRARQIAAAARGDGAQGGRAPAAVEPTAAAACVLGAVSLLVLDEADRLLDMGFEVDVLAVRRLVDGASEQRRRVQTLMFSATWDGKAAALAAALLRERALRVMVGAPTLAVAATVEQRFEVMTGDQRKGAFRMRRLCAVLDEFLGVRPLVDGARGRETEDEDDGDGDGDGDSDMGEADEAIASDGMSEGAHEEDEPAAALCAPASEPATPRVIVFVLHKQQAKAVAAMLNERGFAAAPLHGDLSQSARAHSIARFRAGDAKVLVATDVAARGLDVRGVSHVVNLSLGSSLEMYVHRLGRCGRAGNTGTALSFVVDGDEALVGPLAEMLARQRLAVPEEIAELERRVRTKASRAGAQAKARGGRPDAGARGARDDGASDDDDDEHAAREANREKQLKMQQLKVQKERTQQKPSKHPGGRGGKRR